MESMFDPVDSLGVGFRWKEGMGIFGSKLLANVHEQKWPTKSSSQRADERLRWAISI